MLTREESENTKSVRCEKLASMKDRLAPVAYICIQMFLLVPTIIRAKDELFDFNQPFSIIFWISIILSLTSYFMTHCADPGYIPLDQIALTENSQSCRIQQNGKRSFISQLFKGKGNSNYLNDGGDTQKNIGSQNKYEFKVDSKHTQNDEEETKNKRQQKYLKHVMKQKKNEFMEFKDEEDEEHEDNPQINLDNLKDDKTPPRQKKGQNSQDHHSGEQEGNNGENYVPECELTMEIEENKQKSQQRSFKFEDSCQSAEKQDFVIGLQDIQGKVSAFSPSESRNRSFEQNKQEAGPENTNNQVVSIQDIEQDFKQSSQTVTPQKSNAQKSRKYLSEKQISLPNNEQTANINILSTNSEKLISKEITTQMEEGSTKFTCKTTTQEQFTTQTLEKKTSPYHPCFKSDEDDEDGSPTTKQSQNTQTLSSNKTTSNEQNIIPFQFDIHRHDIHEIVSKRDEFINEKDLTFDKDQKHTHDDNMITDNDNNDIKSQRKMKIQTPVSQIIFFTNNSNNNPSSMFQFNINNLQNEKNNLKGDGETKPSSYQEGAEGSMIKAQWSKNKKISKSGDIENQSNRLDFNDFSQYSKSIRIGNQSNQNTPMPFVEKRYCTSCYINMPLRTKHCKDCKRCVAKFDHHCPYVGNCIGERNKCVFFWFLLLQLGELVIGFLEILKYNCFGQSDKLAYNIYTIFCFIIIAFFFVFVLLLFIYHSYFGTRNITTWEYASWEKISYLSDIPYEFGSPFSMGFLKNFRSFCTFRLFQKGVSDPQYVRFPANLLELQQIRHDKEMQLQNLNYIDLNNNKMEMQQQKNHTD